MANELDEVTGPVNSAGRDTHVIEKQIPVKVGWGSTLFEVMLWVLGILPGVIFLFKKISAANYFKQLEQKIQEQERSIENANAYASAQRSRVRELNDQIWEYEQDLKKLQRERDKAQKIIDAIPADIRAEIDKSMKKKGAKHYEYER